MCEINTTLSSKGSEMNTYARLYMIQPSIYPCYAKEMAQDESLTGAKRTPRTNSILDLNNRLAANLDSCKLDRISSLRSILRGSYGIHVWASVPIWSSDCYR